MKIFKDVEMNTSSVQPEAESAKMSEHKWYKCEWGRKYFRSLRKCQML